MQVRRFALVVSIVCLVSPSLVAFCFGDGVNAPIKPLSRSRAAEVLARASVLADDVSLELANLGDSAEAVAIDDVRDVLERPSLWRWYWRDHGILVAMPVTERLGMLTRHDGELALSDLVSRVINRSGWGNPHVQVVFIEPKLPSPSERLGLNGETPATSFGGEVACPCGE